MMEKVTIDLLPETILLERIFLLEFNIMYRWLYMLTEGTSAVKSVYMGHHAFIYDFSTAVEQVSQLTGLLASVILTPTKNRKRF